MRRFTLFACAFAVLLCVFTLSAARASEADEQRAVAQKFVLAYFLQDMRTVRGCLPDNKPDLFNPYPFLSMPKFSRPKVHDNQALLEFTAATADKRFSSHGGIIYYKHNNIWYVRQVLFYNTVPIMFGLPNHSVTAADRAWEPAVLALGEKFMADWKKNDSASMLGVWHDRSKVDREPIKGLTLQNFSAVIGKTHWRDPFVTYTIEATYHLGFFKLQQADHRRPDPRPGR